ncbi:MAG: Ni/Fe hydrogenase subunit delta [Aquificaceae bacterium]|nr:Ni/Fe hydrogenase subunit delta [Aquificaceae bacterium]MDW8032031.1 Ni/Fe hydrogenase subunit delta [Aquificaceae bacterium]MDW8294644.1 Ni/Fe hydrogenase subunit delta [Aquificaceae bacterium]
MRVGVFKFSSCDGCQLAFFDLEEELLLLSEMVSIDYFLEATSYNRWGNFDLSFVEGSVSTPEEEERIKSIRESSKFLVAIGACAVSGGIQSARNYEDFSMVYSSVYKGHYWVNPRSRPISDFVKVDLEVRGCPINKGALKEVFVAVMHQRSPQLPTYPLCLECKRKGNVCVVVAYQKPCLGPVTVAGCGALCPSFERGCYGCYGPVGKPALEALQEGYERLGLGKENLKELLRLSFNGYNKELREWL